MIQQKSQKVTKSQLLKEALKNAVREVIREELRDILREELRNSKPLLETDKVKKINYNDFLPKPRLQPVETPYSNVNNLPANPLAKFLQDTQRNMTGDEYSSIANMNSGNVVSMPFAGEYAQSVADSISEMQEWTPTNMKSF